MATKSERKFVTERAGVRCEYCRAPEVITGATYHIEHIIPSVLGGADDPSNYALCCMTCNGHKAAHITGIDPKSGSEVTLFNPRHDRWDSHFRFSDANLEIKGKTQKGRATVARLRMNERKQREARSFWLELGLFP
ncbi:MAG: HNH endonuclease [Chthoniobacteraceae bacterium]